MNDLLTMMPAVVLRDVTAADTEFLVAVYASTRAQELAAVPWDDAAKDAFIRMLVAAQDSYWRAQKPGARFAVVMADGEPAGRLYVDRLPAEIRIVDIALLPAYRGRGIGTSLLCDVIAEGRRVQLPVTIHVERFNSARALYDRLGFTQISTTGVYDLLELRPATALDSPSQGALSHG